MNTAMASAKFAHSEIQNERQSSSVQVMGFMFVTFGEAADTKSVLLPEEHPP